MMQAGWKSPCLQPWSFPKSSLNSNDSFWINYPKLIYKCMKDRESREEF